MNTSVAMRRQGYPSERPGTDRSNYGFQQRKDAAYSSIRT